MRAMFVEARRVVDVTPIAVSPGEKSPYTLPYGGRTATEYLRMELEGEPITSVDVNLTTYTITVYKGRWEDTGNNAGHFWAEHLEFITP